jgi:hypothetical protein
MPSPIPFRIWKKWFTRFGVVCHAPNKSSHLKMTRVVARVELITVVALHAGKEIKHPYLAVARRALKLSAADGVPDHVFFGK